jgi:hypothetical protein
LITGILIYAIKRVAAAFTPPEFKKKSMQRPNRKLENKKVKSSFLIG